MNITDELERYAKNAMPGYPSDLCSRAKTENERLRAATSMIGCNAQLIIDAMKAACAQAERKRRPMKELERYDDIIQSVRALEQRGRTED